MPKARNYERELKGILQGDLDTLKRVTRTCSLEERENYNKIVEKPFVVIRSAGSLGIDLVAVRGDVSFPIEVKSSVNRRIHMSNTPRLKEQSKKFKDLCEKASLMPLYAYRLKRIKGDAWRIFTVDIDQNNLKRWIRVIYNRVPKVDISKEGYHILKFDEGKPLNEFIRYIWHISSK